MKNALPARPFAVAPLILVFSLVASLALPAVAAEVPRIRPDEVNALLGSPDLILLDVRAKSHWEKTDRKIRGARRVDPDKVEDWTGTIGREARVVLYCE